MTDLAGRPAAMDCHGQSGALSLQKQEGKKQGLCTDALGVLTPPEATLMGPCVKFRLCLKRQDKNHSSFLCVFFSVPSRSSLTSRLLNTGCHECRGMVSGAQTPGNKCLDSDRMLVSS